MVIRLEPPSLNQLVKIIFLSQTAKKSSDPWYLEQTGKKLVKVMMNQTETKSLLWDSQMCVSIPACLF